MKALLGAALIAFGALAGTATASADPSPDPCDAACHRSWDHWNGLDQQGKKDYLCGLYPRLRPSDC
jgi:hypothetical protein